MRLTRRFIVKSLDDKWTKNPIRYERYYINDKLRIQKKNNIYEKEILNLDNDIVRKDHIAKDVFEDLKKDAYAKIIRDSFLVNEYISIKKYYGTYSGLIRVEVKFSSEEEMNNYIKENWMGSEITDSPLAFDKYLSKLDRQEFLQELKKFL